MSSERQISEVIRRLGGLYREVPNAVLVEKVAMGYLSDNFILRNGEKKFFLKQYRFDDVEKIRAIHHAKFFFADGGIPVFLPLKNDRGEYFFECGEKNYALFPFVAGRIIESPSANALVSAGRVLARMHSWSKGNAAGIAAKTVGGWDKQKFLNEYADILEKINAAEHPSAFDRLAREAMEYKRKLVDENSLQFSDFGLEALVFIHGDYHEKNIFFGEDDEVSHVFDLEKSEYSPRVLEVIRSMDFMCFSGRYAAENYARARAYLDAYRSVLPLGRHEFASGLRVYWLKKAHSLWIEKEHYLNGNTRVDSFLEGELVMLRYLADNFYHMTSQLAHYAAKT